jgi:hypothetical protein
MKAKLRLRLRPRLPLRLRPRFPRGEAPTPPMPHRACDRGDRSALTSIPISVLIANRGLA